MPTILIVDDEPDLAGLVEFHLAQAGFGTAVATTAEQALQLAAKVKPALVVLDLMLPDLSGREVCRRLRADPATRGTAVLMLTARGDEHDRIDGFEAGADDYVTKPFSPRELLLRVKALLRRAGVEATAEKVGLGPVALDLGAHRAFVASNEVALTALEFKLLHHLMARAGRVQTREQLLSDVWGITSPLETRTVDTHVMRLREKLGEARELVETVRGVGYRMASGSRAEAHG
ncbi:MAG: response regulator [Myxococcaceae bacterium]|nr:response regulator [Myxococcaceae bacterium]